MRSLMIIAVGIALAACTQFPELDAAVSDRARAADFPKLIPAERIAAKRTAGGRLGEEDGAKLLARADQLRRRGEILRSLPVVDEAARLRFSAVLNRLGG